MNITLASIVAVALSACDDHSASDAERNRAASELWAQDSRCVYVAASIMPYVPDMKDEIGKVIGRISTVAAVERKILPEAQRNAEQDAVISKFKSPLKLAWDGNPDLKDPAAKKAMFDEWSSCIEYITERETAAAEHK